MVVFENDGSNYFSVNVIYLHDDISDDLLLGRKFVLVTIGGKLSQLDTLHAHKLGSGSPKLKSWKIFNSKFFFWKTILNLEVFCLHFISFLLKSTNGK